MNLETYVKTSFELLSCSVEAGLVNMNKKELLGKRFREIRKQLGLTQEKIAEIAGIEPQSISKIESGKNFPLLSNLEKIAQKLNIELEDFFIYEHKNGDEYTKEALIKIFENLDNESKEKLLRIARVLEK